VKDRENEEHKWNNVELGTNSKIEWGNKMKLTKIINTENEIIKMEDEK